MSSYVQVTGTILSLLVVLVIFLIVTDPRFIDRCKAFGEWCANLFKRKPKEEPSVISPQPSEPENEPEDTKAHTDDDLINIRRLTMVCK